MRNFYQVCYGKPNNNWESFNTSPNATSGAISFFERAANNNTPQNMDSSFVESGIDLFEIVSSDGFTEVSKVRYGLNDNFGRPMMFAHGFVFDDYEKVLEDPNEIVCISNGNFKFTYQETQSSPNDLVMNSYLDVSTAMTLSKIDDNKLHNLIAAINISLSSPSNYPIYIVYKGTEEQKRALMYLILSLIPYSLRCSLSISNANNFKFSMNKSIMIVDQANTSDHYIDLLEETTNIDLESVESDKDLYPFYAALKKYSFEKYDKYCKNLDIVRDKLGYLYHCEYEELVLCNKVLKYLANKTKGVSFGFELMNDSNLMKLLLELLSKAPLSNEIVDEFVYDLLVEYKKRELIPNDVLMQRIRIRSEKSNNQLLKELYKELQMIVLIQNGVEETTSFLEHEYNNENGSFDEWVARIIKSNGGAYIDTFFEIQINNCLKLENIVALWKKAKQVYPNTQIKEKVQKQLYHITFLNMQRRISEENSFESLLDEYAKANFDAFGEDKNSVVILKSIINDFWSSYDINSFEFHQNYIDNIKTIVESDAAPNIINDLLKIFDSVEFLKIDDSDAAREDFEYLLKRYNENKIFDNTLKNKISLFVLDELKYQKNRHILFWYNMAEFKCGFENDAEIIEHIVDNKIEVFISDTAFEHSLGSPRIDIMFLKKLLYALEGSKMHAGYISKVEPKSDEYYLAKDRISKLSKLLKAAEKEEKHRIKEQKKQSVKEHESSEESEDSSDKKSVFKLWSKR